MCEETNYYIKLQFMTEKKDGHGEDAPPLLVIKDEAVSVGVFDGMGGAGAATCKSEYGDDYTKAYVASRIVKKEIEELFGDILEKECISAEHLHERITQRLRLEQESFPPQTKSMLRSKLVRDYPTTLAVVTLRSIGNDIQIDSFWAGDSHCYLWTKKGFFQISKDDLEENNDPMENLRNDSAISNCICADRTFHINHKQFLLEMQPVAILTATDGCFGYFPTPMHFEDMLKKCLRKAKDEKDWEMKVVQEIQKVTGDDTSLSLIGIGFDSFNKFKSIMTTSSLKVIKRLKELEDIIACQKQNLTKMQKLYEQKTRSAWDNYKQKYMAYINEENYGNA